MRTPRGRRHFVRNDRIYLSEKVMLVKMKLRMSNKVGEGLRGWSVFEAKEG